MYVLLCSYPPFDGETDNEILRKVMRGKFVFPEEEWSEISDEAHDFVRKVSGWGVYCCDFLLLPITSCCC